ncbi:multiple sugar transport system permease protein [Rhodococcus fascians]|jgi:trehalose/maltose transport system permease protein|uniref:carbohydrate ABC transporter permease n=1 Tax=Nocardiaceae TaxID=85025 RepID=UPI00061EBF34|nr:MULTISPECIES: sugar ABC transporter permease [Rhodococcus]MDP9637699.1 multiple sugar transport system permease protein [Rhodococcus cercidiphylli]KJV01586.1 ABC sugar transporter, permease component [Rhodococcus sp. PML026]MBY4401113.1 sugar ABC transporter permease [Rhodococcus fascians]MBY4415691.1 sugar ABC transporter permease [Rhodococcus fascians]MDQ0280725.1 multiple sugar transport system permease protein [Rhodococcus fascians]
MAVPAGVTSGAAATTAAGGSSPGRGRHVRSKNKRFGLTQGRAWLLIAPTMVILAIVIVYPVIRALVMSFSKDPGLDPATGMFVTGGSAGFDNYTHWILQQCTSASGTSVPCPPGTLGSQFWGAVGNTAFFTVVTVSIEVVIGFGMAVIMGKTFAGRALLRAAILIPWAIPTAVTAKLWYFIFAYDGVANRILGTNILWTGDAWPARFAVIIADVWKTTPFMALLILAGLQMIPADVYEAARVDGASAWQRFTKITLPLVKPALMVAILFRTMDALRMYDLPAILTEGNPATRTISILVVDQIRQGFNSAASLSTISFIMIFVVAFILVKFLGANAVATQDNQRKGPGR